MLSLGEANIVNDEAILIVKFNRFTHPSYETFSAVITTQMIAKTNTATFTILV